MKLRYCFVLLLITIIGSQPLHAQSNGFQDPEYIEDEGGGLWEKRTFEDATGMQEDFESGGGEYIGEEEAVEAIESAVQVDESGKKIDIKDINQVLMTEKELKFANIKYGALTGVMIGGWLAMVANLSDEGSTQQANARYIGVGVVLGVLLGTAIGTKSLYEQNLRSENVPVPEANQLFLSSYPKNQRFSIDTSDKGMARVSFNYQF
ncbi:MAG: hypothetical protein GY786_19830 [Proteobacteria bacterium]|nr:hypothetical protein [Pseudomonadota bacterium]